MNPPTVVNVLFDDRYGGPQKRVIEIARLLTVRASANTIVVMPEGSGNAAGFAESAGLTVRRLAFTRPMDLRGTLGVLRSVFLLPRDVVLFGQFYRTERADIVHVNGIFLVAAAIAARLTGRRLVWHLNDTIVRRPLAKILGRIASMLADELVVAAGSVALHYGIRRRHFVVPAPVAVDRIKPRKDVDCGRKFCVGLIANWSPAKGVDVFVRGCAIARDRIGDPLHVAVAGARLDTHCAYAAEVNRLIDDLRLRPKVTDYGFVDEIGSILAMLDVLVLASHSEASPMAILEGMAAGLPVVATNVGGVREILEDPPSQAAGIIIPPNDPTALADALVRLYQDAGLRRSMGASGRARAERLFSSERCADRHLRVYHAAMSG